MLSVRAKLYLPPASNRHAYQGEQNYPFLHLSALFVVKVCVSRVISDTPERLFLGEEIAKLKSNIQPAREARNVIEDVQRNQAGG